jgi:aminoglycoside 3-N-acetyltransferase
MTSETPLSKQQIADGLKALGLSRGAILMVHASLSSLGEVDGGAGALIDALLEALGPEGTLLMPTHPARDGRTFHPDAIPSDMGTITETFRLRPGVLRSRHPYHPVAAIGARAEEMLRDHEQSAVPDGPETPYGRLIALDGRVLHIGCDLNTLTLLHTVEAELDLPYLRELEMKYVDAQGKVRTLQIKRCPGGHRGGVWKFDRLFREEGAMSLGRIERAVCRLISAPEAAAVMRREMARDPAFALDDNPHCADCVRFRSKIGPRSQTGRKPRVQINNKAGRLAREDFRLTAPLWAVARNPEQALDLIREEGIAHVELHTEHLPEPDGLNRQLTDRGMDIAVLRTDLGPPDVIAEQAARLKVACLHVGAPNRTEMNHPQLVDALCALAQAAGDRGITALLGNRPDSLAETAEELAALVKEVGSPNLKASYNPAHIARSGGSPFYGGLYKGPLRRNLRHVDLQDVVVADRRRVSPGMGNAEIIEIISSLRCRSFDGYFCLWPLPKQGDEGFREAARGFRESMERI